MKLNLDSVIKLKKRKKQGRNPRNFRASDNYGQPEWAFRMHAAFGYNSIVFKNEKQNIDSTMKSSALQKLQFG